MKAKAWEIAGDPDLYNKVWKVGTYTMECYGYSRTGETVVFADLIPVEGMKIRVIRRYIDPDKELEEA